MFSFRRIGHSLEADVRLVFPSEVTPALTALHGVLFDDGEIRIVFILFLRILIHEHRIGIAGFAEQVFNVSRVHDQPGGDETAPAWQYTSAVRIPGECFVITKAHGALMHFSLY